MALIEKVGCRMGCGPGTGVCDLGQDAQDAVRVWLVEEALCRVRPGADARCDADGPVQQGGGDTWEAGGERVRRLAAT
ncbi:hypothetical protein U9R90_31405 [Streptomyces sp. E11-3]|uniref:hypothetical protein n=1 Tax=Streptomyces sp. E11-3 TaxID=3110112 RepID=UPI00398019EC